jgi:hypothetical protein
MGLAQHVLFHSCGGLPQPDCECSRNEIPRFHPAARGMAFITNLKRSEFTQIISQSGLIFLLACR